MTLNISNTWSLVSVENLTIPAATICVVSDLLRPRQPCLKMTTFPSLRVIGWCHLHNIRSDNMEVFQPVQNSDHLATCPSTDLGCSRCRLHQRE